MARTLRTTLRKTLRALRPPQPPELVPIGDLATPEGREQLIPRQVFQRARERLVHPTQHAAMQLVRETNSDLGWFLFDNEEADAYMAECWSDHPIWDVYRKATFGQMKADIFRYCILFERGGYYLDSNKGLEGKFTDLHPADAEALITYESNLSLDAPDPEVARQLQHPLNLVVQWSMGFAPGHEILRTTIDRIVASAPFFAGHSFSRPKNAILALTGPGMFTHAVREYVSQRGTAGISQAGIDFNGLGIFRLKGSKLATAHPALDYASLRDQEVLKP